VLIGSSNGSKIFSVRYEDYFNLQTPWRSSGG